MHDYGPTAVTTEGKSEYKIKKEKKRYDRLRMQYLAATLLDQRSGLDEIETACEKAGVEDSNAAAILMAQIGKAIGGDTEAARFCRDTAGYRPTESMAIGNLEDKPFETLNLSELTDAELARLAAAKEE